MRMTAHAPVLLLCCLASWPANTGAAQIDVDTSDVPELADFGKKVQEAADKWYPLIIEMLPSDGFTPPEQVSISIRKDKRGVAATSGNRVTGSAQYFSKHQDDVGAFVHELVHVVQAYKPGSTPGWITEGIADYIRWFKYEPQSKRPHPNPDKAKYSDSYRTSAAFLNWAADTYDKKLVVKLNAVCRSGQYSDAFWTMQTGKTIDELNELWIKSLRSAPHESPGQKEK